MDRITSFWTMDRVADALHGGPTGSTSFRRVWTDTRTLEPGDLFVALKGERFDAHDFLPAAVEAGVAGVVVSDARRTPNLGVPVYSVPDTGTALGALGRYRRRAWGGAGKPVIAVAGSNGKTTTKELLRAALGSRLEVHATAANYNNQVGVPLTLLALPDGADVAVIEVGTNHPGEIAILTRIVEPDVAVITSIGEEHLEGLGDLAGVLNEEMAICAGASLAVVPAAQPEVIHAARERAHRVVSVGLDAGDVRASAWSLLDDGRGQVQVNGASAVLPVRGAHNLANAMLAVATAGACGVPADAALAGMTAMAVPSMRMAWEPVGRLTVLNDAYNANPASARAALDLLAAAGGARQRVAVLGTMRELGAATPGLHDEIALRALNGPAEVVAGIGEFAAALARVGAGHPRAIVAEDVDTLWPQLTARLQPDALVLLKASRGVRLERILPLLAAWTPTTRS